MGQANQRGTFEERQQKAILRNARAAKDMAILKEWTMKTVQELSAKATILVATGHLMPELKQQWINDEYDRLTKLILQ